MEGLSELNTPIYVMHNAIAKNQGDLDNNPHAENSLNNQQTVVMHMDPISVYKIENQKKLDDLVKKVNSGEINNYKQLEEFILKNFTATFGLGDPTLRFKMVLERFITESRKDINFSNKFRSLIFEELSSINQEIKKESQIQVREFDQSGRATDSNQSSDMFKDLTETQLKSKRLCPVNPDLIYDFITSIIHDDKILDRHEKLFNLFVNNASSRVGFDYPIVETIDESDGITYSGNNNEKIKDLITQIQSLKEKPTTDSLINGEFTRETYGPAKRKILAMIDKLQTFGVNKDAFLNLNIKNLIINHKLDEAIDGLENIFRSGDGECYEIGAL